MENYSQRSRHLKRLSLSHSAASSLPTSPNLNCSTPAKLSTYSLPSLHSPDPGSPSTPCSSSSRTLTSPKFPTSFRGDGRVRYIKNDALQGTAECSKRASVETKALQMEDNGVDELNRSWSFPAATQKDTVGQVSEVAARSGPEVVEQSSDLLTFIAMKERKILDLKEELSRHLHELDSLKKKWQAMVGKRGALEVLPASPSSFTNQRPVSLQANSLIENSPCLSKRSSIDRHSISAERSTEPSNFSSSDFIAPISSSSQLLSSGSESVILHANDLLSPLSSGIDQNGEINWSEAGEKLRETTRWIGGMMGKALQLGDEGQKTSLEIVQEEEEEGDIKHRKAIHSSPKSVSSLELVDSKRTSISTTSSAISSTVSTFSFPNRSHHAATLSQTSEDEYRQECASPKLLPQHSRQTSAFGFLGSTIQKMANSDSFKNTMKKSNQLVGAIERSILNAMDSELSQEGAMKLHDHKRKTNVSATGPRQQNELHSGAKPFNNGWKEFTSSGKGGKCFTTPSETKSLVDESDEWFKEIMNSPSIRK